MKQYDAVIYESKALLGQVYLHRFLLAQTRELIAIGYNVIFCTGDNPNDLKNKFIDANEVKADAISCRDSGACKKLKPKILFTSRIDSALNIMISNMFASAKFAKILWYGGVIPEESYLRRRSILRRYVLLFLERVALRWADIVLVPTKSMLCYLESNNRLPKNTKYLVVPNAIESLPPLVDDSKGLWELADRSAPVIGYCGGLAEWQCFEEAIDFVKNIQNVEPNIHFLVLTYEPQKAREMILKKGIANTLVKQTSPENVYKYIQSFDVGILFRYDNTVNTVAFPLKYLDYISNGVPVITTTAVKAITSDALANYGFIIEINSKIDYKSILEKIRFAALHKNTIANKLRVHSSSKWTFQIANMPIRNAYSDIYDNINK